MVKLKSDMKINYLIIFLFLAAFFFLSLSSVSAADDVYVNASSGNDSNDGSSWEKAKLSIKNATGTAKNGTSVYLADGNYSGQNNSNIIIDKNITISGQKKENTIINGHYNNMFHQIFIVLEGNMLNLQNMTITNGSSNGDSTILNNGNFTATNCTFYNNIMNSNSAVLENYGSVNLTDCNFTNNAAYNTIGGAIYNENDLELHNCTFVRNLADDGGAIYNKGYAYIVGCNFVSNVAYGDGGAIYNEMDLELYNCTFIFNSAENGGAIYNYNGAYFMNCTFMNNTVTGEGGAIVTDDSLNIFNSTFTGNDRCAVINSENGSLLIAFSKFSKNPSYDTSYDNKGGAIENKGRLNVIFCEFEDNIAGYFDCISSAITNYDTADVICCNFTNNRAYLNGGAIFNNGSMKVVLSNFINNGAYLNGKGGAIFNNGTMLLAVSNFTSNSASYGEGGAIYNSNYLEIIQSIFKSNSAGYGGAIQNVGNMTVDLCSLISNLANYGNGGAISNGLNLNITNSNLTLNSAGNFGGAIYNYGDLNINYSNLTSNSAAMIAGAVYNLGKMEINTSSLNYNSAVIGGAINNQGTLTINNSLIHRNSASYNAGAINNPGILSIYFSTITCNTADNFGGFLNNDGTTDVHFSHIIGNDAFYLGDEIYCNRGNVNAINNWWGSNKNPCFNSYGDYSYTPFYGNVIYTPWINSTVTVSAIPKSGLYNTALIITLSSNEPGTIYYTLDGTVPTPLSNKYTGPITITTSQTIRFMSVSSLNIWSPISSETYTIDKIAPKVTLTSPKNRSTKTSRTSTIVIKLSEKIKSSINWSKIFVKNKYGKKVSITKWISGNVLYIKTTKKRSSYSYYTVYIPSSAIKDYAGNNLARYYAFKFKTGK